MICSDITQRSPIQVLLEISEEKQLLSFSVGGGVRRFNFSLENLSFQRTYIKFIVSCVLLE